MSCQQYQAAVQLARTSADFDLTSMMDVCLCPECKVPIDKSSGCSHMHCPYCDTHICCYGAFFWELCFSGLWPCLWQGRWAQHLQPHCSLYRTPCQGCQLKWHCRSKDPASRVLKLGVCAVFHAQMGYCLYVSVIVSFCTYVSSLADVF